TASDQLEMRLGGQSTPRGGDKTNRYTSVRPRIISVRANISAGQSRDSSVMEPLAREYQTEATVGSSLRKLGVSTSCSWWAIVASFSLLIPLSGDGPLSVRGTKFKGIA